MYLNFTENLKVNKYSPKSNRSIVGMAILISIIVPSIVTQSKIKVNNQQHFYYRYQKGVRNTGKIWKPLSL